MEEQNNEYRYTYAAPTAEERKVIENIRRQYIPESEQEQDLKKLRELDAKVENIPTCIALIVGTVGCLIFGLGMACVLKFNLFVVGVLIGLFGLAITLAAYPSYKFFVGRYRKKYGGKILALSDELLKNIDEDRI